MMLTSSFFFFNDTATTEIYTLSLHDALPIYLPANLTGIEVIRGQSSPGRRNHREAAVCEHKSKAAFVMRRREIGASSIGWRSEEHTSELQSQSNLVCRLLLEKKQD